MGAPYFDTIAVPVGLALLLMMAVAPALSWRKVDGRVLWQRLRVPAWVGVLTVVGCVIGGVRGLEPLVGFGLGAFAAASALRSLALSVRASRRHGAGAWRGLVGRANGGMVVHLGVVVLAVGLVAATSFRSSTELALRRGEVVTYDGHTLEYEGLRVTTTPQRTATEAVIRVDGGGLFYPAVSQYDGSASEGVGTPAIDSGFFGDVYLTLSGIGGTGQSTGAQGIPDLPGRHGGRDSGGAAADRLDVGGRCARRPGRPAGPPAGGPPPAHRPGLVAGPGGGGGRWQRRRRRQRRRERRWGPRRRSRRRATGPGGDRRAVSGPDRVVGVVRR